MVFRILPRIRKPIPAPKALYGAIIEYYGSKYSQYRRLLPSEIIKKLLDNTERQLLPSKGLTDRELARCLQNNGFQCKIYSNFRFSLFTILQIYKAYALAGKIFNHDIIGLQAIGGKWITRLLLTGSHSFKDFIFNKCDGIMPDKLKKYLLLLSLPRFIWICEVYRIQEFVKDGYCSGLLIIDATSDGKSLASVLWYTLDEHMFMHDNVDWYPESEPIKPFRMNTYRNNLKGEWNEWKSGK